MKTEQIDLTPFQLEFTEIGSMDFCTFKEYVEIFTNIITKFELPDCPSSLDVTERMACVNNLRDMVKRFSMVVNAQFIKLEYIYNTVRDYNLNIGKNSEERKSNSAKFTLQFLMDKETYRKLYYKYPDNIVMNGNEECVMVNLMDLISDAEQKKSFMNTINSMIDRKHEALTSMSYLINRELKVTNG